MYISRNNMPERIKNTFMTTLEIQFIENDNPQILEATMPVNQRVAQSMGFLHGGATIALAESVAGVGSNSICAENERCVGLQIAANHISIAKMGDMVRAIGTLRHKGKTTHIWDIDIISEQTKKLISTVRVTNAVIMKMNN